MNYLLKLLERYGRKAILVDFYGRVLMERWYLLYYEDEQNPRPWSRLPNVWIHHFPGPDSPDGEDEHQHPYSTLSVILKGWYDEVVTRPDDMKCNSFRLRKKGTWCFQSYRTSHRICLVKPGTWSIFAHWVRRQDWAFEVKPCTNVCQACEELNYRRCFKTTEILDYEEQFSKGNGAVGWERVNADTEKKLERRRAAVARMGLKVPASKEEGRYEMKKRVIRGSAG